jgi:hypothetical protein
MEISETGKILKFSTALILILTGAALRLLPHAPNFTPIATIALFGGVYLDKKMAFVLPIAAMIISDIFLGFYDLKLMAAVYGSFLFCVIIGFWLKKHKKWHAILGGSISCGLVFFLITNFAVWIFTPWYAKTFSGIIQCYLMALPFFKNDLLGNIFYAIVLFGAFESAKVIIVKKYGKSSVYSPA